MTSLETSCYDCFPAMTIKSKIRFRLRAAVVVLMLAAGWLSGPLALAAWEPDVCEMECCIEAGHCCCATRHAYVKGQEPKPGEVAFNIETNLTAPCPANCTGSATATQNYLSRATHAPTLLIELAFVPLPHCSDQFLFAYPFAARPSSPRAPPIHNRFAA